jgi:hypothetical protein
MNRLLLSHIERVTALAVVLFFGSLAAHAQWRTQTLVLQPGWNAVHLEVAPAPDDCDTLFANTAVESVWKWNRRFTSVQFVEDPQSLVPEDPDWLVWLPPDSSQVFLRRLRSLQANQSYLVRVAESSGPISLQIKGRVVMPRLDWYPHGLNLVGFPVNTVNPPTFAEFFAFTDEVDTTRGFENELFKLDAQGRGQRIVQPARDRVEPGRAYWVGIDEKPAHMSRLHVRSPGGALDFGTSAYSQELTIQNTHPTESTGVLLQLRDSETPPQEEYPELAGPVALSYLAKNEDGSGAWLPLPAGLSQILAPGETWTIRLGLRREDLPAFQPSGDNGAAYQGILNVSDLGGTVSIDVPVSATSVELVPQPLLAGASDPLLDFEEKAGLWVGEALLSRVNAPAYTTNDVIQTPAPMTLRLMMHVDSSGQARLLQGVLLAWDPTLTDAPHTNGTYALYAHPDQLPEDAENVKRISTVGFPLMEPVALTLTNDTYSGTVEIGFDNPTNPFLHRYHPMHDNKDWDFVAYTNAVEVPDITRYVQFTVIENTNEVAHPIWGVDAISGTYTETMTGLRAQPVVVQGPFSLQRISRIDQLQGVTP